MLPLHQQLNGKASFTIKLHANAAYKALYVKQKNETKYHISYTESTPNVQKHVSGVPMESHTWDDCSCLITLDIAAVTESQNIC